MYWVPHEYGYATACVFIVDMSSSFLLELAKLSITLRRASRSRDWNSSHFLTRIFTLAGLGVKSYSSLLSVKMLTFLVPNSDGCSIAGAGAHTKHLSAAGHWRTLCAGFIHSDLISFTANILFAFISFTFCFYFGTYIVMFQFLHFNNSVTN
jgi:hypothetical protein